jgi:hypothetical protein
MPELTPQSVAHEALLEITPEESIGAFIGVIDEGDGIVTVQYESALAGYPGWKWTVSVSTLEGLDPSVLETELIPSDGSLLAPDWVPWSDRLADYKAAQELASADSADSSDDPDDDSDDDSDDDDDDDLGSDVLHGGDLDGVDIDAVDESEDDELEDEDSDDDFEESDDDDLDEGLREV